MDARRAEVVDDAACGLVVGVGEELAADDDPRLPCVRDVPDQRRHSRIEGGLSEYEDDCP